MKLFEDLKENKWDEAFLNGTEVEGEPTNVEEWLGSLLIAAKKKC